MFTYWPRINTLMPALSLVKMLKYWSDWSLIGISPITDTVQDLCWKAKVSVDDCTPMGVWLVSLDSTPIEGWLVFLQSRFHFRQSLTQCKSSVWKLKYREVIRVRWEFDWYLLIRLRLKVDWYFCNPDSTFGNLRHSASIGRWLHSYWSLIGISCDCISPIAIGDNAIMIV